MIEGSTYSNDETFTGTIYVGQSRPGSNRYEGVHHIFQTSGLEPHH